jgi:F0F1-type ATP synthase assembly protein I
MDNDRLFEMTRDRFASLEANQNAVMQKLDRIEEAISKVSERVTGSEREIENIKDSAKRNSAWISLIVSTVIGAVIGWINHLIGKP